MVCLELLFLSRSPACRRAAWMSKWAELLSHEYCCGADGERIGKFLDDGAELTADLASDPALPAADVWMMWVTCRAIGPGAADMAARKLGALEMADAAGCDLWTTVAEKDAWLIRNVRLEYYHVLLMLNSANDPKLSDRMPIISAFGSSLDRFGRQAGQDPEHLLDASYLAYALSEWDTGSLRALADEGCQGAAAILGGHPPS